MSSNFNLTAAIETWRNELAAQPQLTPDNRRELERHLIDSMADFRARGLADEEAFWLACRRIGRPQQLAEEYEKADPVKVWRQRIFWLALAVFVWRLFEDVVGDVSFVAVVRIPHHGGPYAGMRPGIAWGWLVQMLVSGLVPLLLFVLTARGTLVPQLQKLLALIRNRRRLTRTILILLLLTISTRIVADWALNSAGIATAFSMQLWYVFDYLNDLLLGLTVIWLRPAEPKVLKTA